MPTSRLGLVETKSAQTTNLSGKDTPQFRFSDLVRTPPDQMNHQNINKYHVHQNIVSAILRVALASNSHICVTILLMILRF